MAFTDRIGIARYTSPSGREFTFNFTDVERSISHKVGEFLFPEIDGALFQDLSTSAMSYPMTIYFNGCDHDLDADRFMDALKERGPGRLDHPRYGLKTVQIISVSQTDALVTESAQTAFSIEFKETLLEEYPTSFLEERNTILADINLSNLTQSEQFLQALSLENSTEIASFLSVLNSSITTIGEELSDLMSQDQNLLNSFNASFSILSLSSTSLIDDPESLASLINRIILLPAESSTIFTEKLSSYTSLLDSFLNIQIPTSTNENRNLAYQKQLYLYASILGLCKSVYFSEFETKKQAIEYSELIFSYFNQVRTQLDGIFDLYEVESIADQFIADTNTYSLVLRTVETTIARLVRISFGLKVEKRIILDRDRTPISLTYDLYNDYSDELLDFLIQTNELNKYNILIIPQGTEVLYYV